MAFDGNEVSFIGSHYAYTKRLGAIAVIEDASAPRHILFATEDSFDVHKYLGSQTAVDPKQRTGNPPFSPVVNLIQGLFGERGAEAAAVLRTNPIRTNYNLHAMCRGMIEIVGAKGAGPAVQYSNIAPSYGGNPEAQRSLLD
ncbi:MAG: hypothetical protein ACYDBZ_06795 [Steroidobacteraceae bacterium]